MNVYNSKRTTNNEQRTTNNDLSLRAEKGFTLIELSIVIVLIGLIVAGVVGGQVLVNQAKLRSVLSESNEYQVAINAFKLEYNYIPGDLPRAFAHWGSQNGCTNSTVVHPSSNPNGCNGDGNKRISHWGGEGYRAWQHLALAGIIPGSYTGIAYTGNGNAEIGITVPASSRDNTGFSIIHPANGKSFGISVGGQRGGPSSAKTFTPKEVQSMDKKIDDGSAASGFFYGADGQSGGNVPYLAITAGTCLTAGEYDLTLDSKECFFWYTF